jgi:GPH family glycoside/pentoside/hexuronide:cation symporter
MSLQKPPIYILLIYAVGQMGWSIAGAGITNMLEYFYFPPETAGGHALFPSFVYQGAVLGFMTFLGIIGASGRFLDAIVDPIVAYWSDKLEFSWGKRRVFMAFAAIPCALLTWMLYFPPIPHESMWNVVYLGVVVVLMYVSWTCYVVPYTALISELGHTEREQILISAFISVAYASGFMLVAQAQRFQHYFELRGYDTVSAFQYAMGIIMAIGAACMLFPVAFLDEKKYCMQSEEMPPFREAWARVWANTNFKWFAISDFFYWFALNFIQKGGQYYIIVLLGLPKEAVSDFTIKVGLLSFVCYLPISYFAMRWSKKRMLTIAFILLSLCFLFITIMGKIPCSPDAQIWILLLIAMMPIATFGILQNVLVADIVHEQHSRTGVGQAGMFYAVLLLLGKSPENDLGVRMTGVVAFVFTIVGLIVFQQFREVRK